MKKILTASVLAIVGIGSASAADLPARTYTKAPAMVAAAPVSWTGCYVGVEGGYGWGRESVVFTPVGTAVTTVKPKGGLGGGTIGCNWQSSNFVIGIENDLSATGLSGSSADLPPFNTAFSHGVSTSWLDTLRGRVGLAWNSVLLYATAGAAFTNVRDSATGGGAFIAGTTNRTGWTAGVGAEYMFAPNWSAKVEYLYADFGTLHDAFDVSSAGFFVGVNTHLTENIVRAGINYHFNWAGPVVAKY
jgi:outer membrane immunogenic protein